MQGYSQNKKYIATQGELHTNNVHLNSKINTGYYSVVELEALNFVGPLPSTVTDFWWLVWQERVHVIAMVTNTVERGQQKCEQYWPDKGTKEYGPFKVTLTDQQVFADYTIRHLFVSVSLHEELGIWKIMLQLLIFALYMGRT